MVRMKFSEGDVVLQTTRSLIAYTHSRMDMLIKHISKQANAQVSSDQSFGWLFYKGDYTTHLYTVRGIYEITTSHEKDPYKDSPISTLGMSQTF